MDRPKAALFGLNTTTVANTIRTNVAGTIAAQYRQGGYEYPIIVRLKQEDREQVSDVNEVMVNTASGVSLPVKNVMVIQSQLGPSQIERKNQERLVMVSAEPEIPLSEAVSLVQQRLPEISRPQDFSIGFGAEVEQQAKTFNELRLVLILALILVYAVMASQYESLRDPFIIMFSVPTAAIGVVLALYLTNTSFNLQAYLGVIMLGGIVVSNGILLVDYTNILRRRDGMELREAVEVAGRTRLRPILMTALATMLGLVPMALGIGEGSELQVPLARVVIGGLLTSTFITLVFVPTVYTLFEEGLSGLEEAAGTNAGRRALNDPAVTELSHGCAERSRRTQRQISRCAKYCFSPLLSQCSPVGATLTTGIPRSRSLRRLTRRVSRAVRSQRPSAPPGRFRRSRPFRWARRYPAPSCS